MTSLIIFQVAYFTTLCPLIILIVLMVLGCKLEGSSTGIYVMLEPRWDKLKDMHVGTRIMHKIIQFSTIHCVLSM